MKILNAYSRFLNVLERIVRVLLVASLGAMVAIMMLQVIMRYVFSNALPWCEELTCYLGMVVILLGLGIASRRESHLQVDFLIRLYGPRLRSLLGAVFSVVSVVVMIIFCKYTISTITHTVSVSAVLPLKISQVYYAFLVGGVLVILYSIETAARHMVAFFNKGDLPPIPAYGKKGVSA